MLHIAIVDKYVLDERFPGQPLEYSVAGAQATMIVMQTTRIADIDAWLIRQQIREPFKLELFAHGGVGPADPPHSGYEYFNRLAAGISSRNVISWARMFRRHTFLRKMVFFGCGSRSHYFAETPPSDESQHDLYAQLATGSGVPIRYTLDTHQFEIEVEARQIYATPLRAHHFDAFEVNPGGTRRTIRSPPIPHRDRYIWR